MIKAEVELLLNKITEEIEAQIQTIKTDAQQAILELRRDGEKEREQEAQSILRTAENLAEQTRTRSVSQAHIDARNKQIQTRNEILKGVLLECQQNFYQLPKTSKYPLLLQSLIRKAMASLAQKEIMLFLRPQDRELISENWLQEISQKYRCTVRVEEPEHYFIGGVFIRSADGMIEVDGTLESFFQAARASLSAHASKMLFQEAM